MGSETDHFYAVEVEVTACRPVTFSDLAWVLDELNEDVVTVRVRRDNLVPPMAGDLDAVITLALFVVGAGGLAFVTKFAGMLAEDTYKGLRHALRHLRDRADKVSPERIWTLTLQFGSHPFQFQGQFTDEQFVEMLRAAQVILDRSPEALIARRAQPPEMEPGWYWRGDRWEATPALREWMERADDEP